MPKLRFPKFEASKCLLNGFARCGGSSYGAAFEKLHSLDIQK